MWRGLTAWIVLVAVAAAGCAFRSPREVLAARDQGETRVYRVAVDDAWRMSRTVLRELDAGLIEEHRDEGYMVTQSTYAFLSGAGVLFAVWIEPRHEGETAVTTASVWAAPLSFMNARPPLTERAFHERFAAMIGRR